MASQPAPHTPSRRKVTLMPVRPKGQQPPDRRAQEVAGGLQLPGNRAPCHARPHVPCTAGAAAVGRLPLSNASTRTRTMNLLLALEFYKTLLQVVKPRTKAATASSHLHGCLLGTQGHELTRRAWAMSYCIPTWMRPTEERRLSRKQHPDHGPGSACNTAVLDRLPAERPRRKGRPAVCGQPGRMFLSGQGGELSCRRRTTRFATCCGQSFPSVSGLNGSQAMTIQQMVLVVMDWRTTGPDNRPGHALLIHACRGQKPLHLHCSTSPMP